MKQSCCPTGIPIVQQLCQPLFLSFVTVQYLHSHAQKSIKNFLPDRLQCPHAPFQNSLHIGNQNPIIGHRDLLIDSAAKTALHLPRIQHTAAAMNDQLIAGHILWKFRPRCKMKLRRFSRVLTDPSRQLLRADVTALAMMRTALGNKDRISVLYHFQRFCALCRLFQIPLIPRKQNGKGSQTHLRRRQPAEIPGCP